MAKKDNGELEFEGSDKMKALQAAMDKIEKNFGKGSIMKLGDEIVQEVEVIPTGSIGLIRREESLKSSVRNRPVRRHLPFMPLLRHRSVAASLLSSMRNMRSTVSMRPSWVSTLTICGFPNPTAESRHWRLPNS